MLTSKANALFPASYNPRESRTPSKTGECSQGDVCTILFWRKVVVFEFWGRCIYPPVQRNVRGFSRRMPEAERWDRVWNPELDSEALRRRRGLLQLACRGLCASCRDFIPSSSLESIIPLSFKPSIEFTQCIAACVVALWPPSGRIREPFHFLMSSLFVEDGRATMTSSRLFLESLYLTWETLFN
jgi:hypothetical protein